MERIAAVERRKQGNVSATQANAHTIYYVATHQSVHEYISTENDLQKPLCSRFRQLGEANVRLVSCTGLPGLTVDSHMVHVGISSAKTLSKKRQKTQDKNSLSNTTKLQYRCSTTRTTPPMQYYQNYNTDAALPELHHRCSATRTTPPIPELHHRCSATRTITPMQRYQNYTTDTAIPKLHQRCSTTRTTT